MIFIVAPPPLPLPRYCRCSQAFEAFRAAYPKASILDGNKRLLRERFDEAKAAAEAVNAARNATNQVRARPGRQERALSILAHTAIVALSAG